jgi:4-hydroxy-tetrahydrodipicolinate synthase
MTTEFRPIQGSIPALITPMLTDGQVDYPTLRKLIDWHVAEGTDALVIVGTSGESPTVTVDEHREILRVSVEQAAKRIPIIAGCGANSTAEAIALAKFAESIGADAQLQVVPYYNKPTQEGLFQHPQAAGDFVQRARPHRGRFAARHRPASGPSARHHRHQGSHGQHRTRAVADP